MKRSKKVVNLSEHVNLKDAFKHLYNNNEVKDDNQESYTFRGTGTQSTDKVDELPPNCS